MTTLPLGSEFSVQTQDAWLKLVEKTLKGAEFEKALVTSTYDGIPIQPLYTREDFAAADEAEEIPGLAPFTRGSVTAGPKTLPWHICQSHAHPDPDANNAAILTDLEGGVSAVSLKLAGRNTDGILVTSATDLETILDGVSLEIAPIFLEPSRESIANAAQLLSVIAKRKCNAEAVSGNLGADPIGVLASQGQLEQSLQDALRQTCDLAHHVSRTLPNIRSVLVDTRAYHFGGASEAQEIAVALATGVAYLRALEAGGLDLTTAASQIGFTMTADADMFTSTAKLRAARRLWAKATGACGIEPVPMALRVESAARMMTDRDVWMNMLRTTAACFAAGIAGAGVVTLHPYTAASGLPDGFGRRIARNTQIILQEESSIGQVTDPAGGSWYLERLTADLADKSWALFQELERDGGIAASLASGALQERISQVAEARRANIERRKDPIVGVSEFPNLEETQSDVLPIDRTAVQANADDRLKAHLEQRGQSFDLSTIPPAANSGMTAAMIEACEHGATHSELASSLAGEPHSVAPVGGTRLSVAFEALRSASDGYLERNGTRPSVFLANLGTAAQFTARSAYSKNFFGSGGIETLSNNGFTDDDRLAEAFRKSGAAAAVLCSSDAVYADRAASAATVLRKAGATHLYLAGHPGDRRDEFAAAGIASFIHMGCNVIDLLKQAHQILGVERS